MIARLSAQEQRLTNEQSIKLNRHCVYVSNHGSLFQSHKAGCVRTYLLIPHQTLGIWCLELGTWSPVPLRHDELYRNAGIRGWGHDHGDDGTGMLWYWVRTLRYMGWEFTNGADMCC